jgi:NAD(P)-dependent dehydrogenase (short-subunit alcohol dehydrogenase family)
MNIEGSNVLVLGGHGLVGHAVCRALLEHAPATLMVAARREATAGSAADALREHAAGGETRIEPLWGDIFLRADWRAEDGAGRDAVLADPEHRQRLLRDIFDPLDDENLDASCLGRLIMGRAPGLDGVAADIVIDCINTATAISYRNVYASAQELMSLAREGSSGDALRTEVEAHLAASYVPQLVRHVQLLYAAMRRAGTGAYVKVGTSGTGGMGFNIPYTHGEEQPSRLLLSKAAMAGAQTMLTFLLARTPDGPPLVKEVKPSAMIGWRDIGYGPIRRGGRAIELFDCPPDQAVPASAAHSRQAQGDFGVATGEVLKGVYIDTGENGQYSADEFAAITTLGQMEMITAEEIARDVVRELRGVSSGHEIVAALDGAIMGPTYRGGFLRQSALATLRALEAEHGDAVAYEILGPPRLSKLLFELHLIKQVYGTVGGLCRTDTDEVAGALADLVRGTPELRQRILSIGVPILLPDGGSLLRGPLIRADNAESGWVDLTAPNMRRWQQRASRFEAMLETEDDADRSSFHNRAYQPATGWSADAPIPVGELVAWLLTHDQNGGRMK